MQVVLGRRSPARPKVIWQVPRISLKGLAGLFSQQIHFDVVVLGVTTMQEEARKFGEVELIFCVPPTSLDPHNPNSARRPEISSNIVALSVAGCKS